ncbi:MAG TPA: hypothetical protein VFG04_07175 [Planctomycetaceae bacterium]|jgi:hypothetical protein|nr:hypothetical protein [Planctomycetaceae bacterium]
METVNRILVTLVEANHLACATNPHHQRLAIVLLDNIIELELRRTAEKAFLWDRTTWYAGVRKHNRKRRNLVSRQFHELLTLAAEESLITDDDTQQLAYTHRVRNRVFHQGWPEDSSDLLLSITLLYRFIRRHFPIWRSSGWLMLPRESAIPIAEAKDDHSGRAPLLFGFEDPKSEECLDFMHGFQSESHWSRVLEHCLTFDDSRDVRPLIKQRITNLLDKIEQRIDYLTESDLTDFNSVLAQRFSIMTPVFEEYEIQGKAMRDPATALNIYLAVLDSEERLLDIADPAERAAKFHEILDAHKFRPDIISSLQLDEYRQRAQRVTTQSEPIGITQFLEIEERLEAVGRAASECALDLDAYEQWMLDCSRGK